MIRTMMALSLQRLEEYILYIELSHSPVTLGALYSDEIPGAEPHGCRGAGHD